jgi:hypothetical protein
MASKGAGDPESVIRTSKHARKHNFLSPSISKREGTFAKAYAR